MMTVRREEVEIERLTSEEHVNRLAEFRTDLLVFGGIDKVSEQRLIFYNIRAYPWVTGMAEDALHSILRGDLESGIMIGPSGCRHVRWRFTKNNEQCRSEQKNKEVNKMPRGDGTGPKGQGSGTGRGMGRGAGVMSRGGVGQGLGGYYVCPNCGERAAHQLGSPCYEQQCPKCGTAMTRE